MRGEGERIIEDFMLAANETVAEEYFWRQSPFLYRVHDDPDSEKMKSLAAFLGNFGFVLHIRQGKVYPKELQQILEKAGGKPSEALVKRIVLRSMQQAKYSPENRGHFGLAAEYYTHFTSPIRRYPDLQIHRIIKETIAGGMNGRRVSHFERILPEVAVKTSALERRAEDAEREVEKLKKVEYMEKYVGEEFAQVIDIALLFKRVIAVPDIQRDRITNVPYADDSDSVHMLFRQSADDHIDGAAVRIKKGQTVAALDGAEDDRCKQGGLAGSCLTDDLIMADEIPLADGDLALYT
jgi:VacB/RNase II family 3'-5' exoribonuclease